MAHLESFEIENFKIFSDAFTFNFAPVTLLTGPNSCGKSSLIRALEILGNSNQKDENFKQLRFNEFRSLGSFENSVNDKCESDPKHIRVCFPFPLDYFDKKFFIDLKFEKSSTGSKRNGKLVFLEIYCMEEGERTVLVHLSYAKFDFNTYKSENIEEYNSLPEETIEELKTDMVVTRSVNMLFIEKFLNERKISVTEESLLKEADQIVNGNKEEEYNFLSTKDLMDEFGETYSPEFYLNKSKRQLKLCPSFSEKLKPAFFKDKYSLFMYYPKDEPTIIGPFSIPSADFNKQIDKKLLSKIVKSENKALEKLSLQAKTIGNTVEDLLSNKVFSNQEDLFESDYISNYIYTYIQKIIDEELESLEGDFLRTSSLSEYGSLLIDELLINNIKSGLKEIQKLLDMDFLGPLRGSQERVISFGNPIGSLNNIIEEFIELDTSLNTPVKLFINYWIKSLGIGDSLIIESSNSGLTKAVLLKRNDSLVNLSDLGFGISQLIPIILNIAITAYKKSINHDAGVWQFNSSIICIEEPESNLHPALQSKLADMFIDASYRFNMQFIIETHSEYIVRKFQYWISKGIITSDSAKVYYFHSEENKLEGREKIVEINIKDNGALSEDFGSGFFDEADNIAISIWNVNNSQSN